MHNFVLLVMHGLFLFILDSLLLKNLELQFIHLDFIDKFRFLFFELKDLFLAVNLSLVSDFHVVNDLFDLNLIYVNSFLCF
jgi:hypothetical protein